MFSDPIEAADWVRDVGVGEKRSRNKQFDYN